MRALEWILERTLSPLYQCGHRYIQSRKKPYRALIPVICVGNAVAGGSGKTPSSIALCDILIRHKIKSAPCFLSRGYGGTIKAPTQVDPAQHNHKDVGDESLLLARYGMTIIAENRQEGAVLVKENAADTIIMDDGLQNASLVKDISFMVVDGAVGFGNMKTLPAGPLREELNSAFDKTNAFILIGDDVHNIRALLPMGKPVFQASIQPVYDLLPDKDVPVVAFTGLGRPEKFLSFLQDAGYMIKGWHAYADHHNFSDKDMQKLNAEAMRENAQLVTTEKDYMRLRDSFFRDQIQTVPIRLVFQDEDNLVVFLKERLGS